MPLTQDQKNGWPVFPSDLELSDEERERAFEEEQSWAEGE